MNLATLIVSLCTLNGGINLDSVLKARFSCVDTVASCVAEKKAAYIGKLYTDRTELVHFYECLGSKE